MTKTIKQILAIILTFIMIVSTMPMAFATDAPVANGTAGEGVTWVLDSDGTLTISGTGAIVVDWYSPPWEDYNESITSIVIEEGITEVPDSVFCCAENLVTVSVPSTVTEFGDTAFWECYSLEEINVAEANTVYKDIDGILFTEDETTLVTYPMNKAGAEYTIPASVTTIGKDAFAFNVALESVIIPDTVTSLGEGAFEYAGIDSVILGNGITNIPHGCFDDCYDIKSIIIPDSVTTIEDYAFNCAYGLETLVIGSGVESIGEWAVNATDNLTTIHYKGTQEKWNAISIAEDNAYLYEDELHFISEDDYHDGVTPTCVDGHTAGYYCDECDAYLTGEVIPAVDEHDYDDVVTEPTCTEGGYTIYTCTVCVDWFIDDETVPLGHQIGDDDLCGVCGEECTHIDEKVDGKCDFCDFTFDYKAVDIEATNTVYIPEAHESVIVKFTPAESGWYAVVSDNGGNDDINDPYVSIFNADGKEIKYNDDSDYEDTYNFYCEFEAKAGKIYYIALSSYDSEVEYDYTIEKLIEIAHQPTSGEPYVELNWDVDADYQWYSVEVGDTEATDENAEPYSYNDATATYDSVNGWTSVVDIDDYYSSATLELNEGEKVIVEFAEGGFEYCGFWDFDAGHEGDGCEENDGVLAYEFTMDADGVYTFYTKSLVAHKIYVGDYGYTAIDSETDATLENPEIGTKYICKVTLENGDVLTSNVLEYTYAIIHQPTADEPYVELNDDTDATYQWYSAEKAIVELTDENTIAFPSEDEGPIYDAEKGWSGVHIGTAETYDCYAYFIVPLQAGDTISIELSGDYYGIVELVNIETEKYYIGEIDDDGKCEFTAKEDGYYAVSAYRDVDGDDVFVKAYIGGYEYTAIDGATSPVCTATENGLYACEVTFADDSTEMSDVFEKTQKLQGWILESGKWAYYENNVKLTNCWKQDSKGWCYLDADGYMATNKWVRDSKGWCYVGADGYCVTDKWIADSVGWCYLGADGRMVTNKWVMDSVGWCYVGADGYCVTDKWVADSKGWCYLGADGRMVTNKWVKDSKGWCYVGADGYCLTNAWKADSKGWCYLDANGRMVVNNWVQDGGKWYYLDGNGYMVTGTKTIGGKTYKFNTSGVWIP